MGFDKGTLNVGFFVSPNGVGDEFEAAIQAAGYAVAAPTLDESVEDWTSGISLSDLGEIEDRPEFRLGGAFYAASRTRQLKVDASLVREELARRIHEETAKTNAPVLSKRRKIIKEEIRDALAVKAKLVVSGVRLVLSPDRKLVLAEVTGMSKADAFLEHLGSTVAINDLQGFAHMSPEYLYEAETGRNSGEYVPFSLQGVSASMGIGRDFLTWLWMASESEGVLAPLDAKEIKVGLVGDVKLQSDIDNAPSKVVAIKGGAPANSHEPEACFGCGKKVVSGTFSFACGANAWTTVLDEDFFCKRLAIVETPSSEEEPHSAFETRLQSCLSFQATLRDLFKLFVSMGNVEKLINLWVDERRKAHL